MEHSRKLIEAGRGVVELNTVFFAPYYGTPITKCPGRFGVKIESERMSHNVITMREAVTSTEGLSVNEVVRAKREFDERLREYYVEEAGKTTKEELLRGSGHRTSGHTMNQSWLNAWRSYPHIMEFMRHIKSEEQECNLRSYPIRTMTEYEIEGESICERGRRISGVRAELLRLADGKRQIHEISEYTCLSESEVMELYRELNNECLIYFSEF